MKTRKTRRITWNKFSEKHQNYIKNCENATFNIAEGAVRSGKTVCNVLAFALALERCPDRLHLATGTTLATARMNIGDCNGYGLEYLFRGRCRWGKYRDNPALRIQTESGEKIVVFAGGGKADSYKKIRGNSYGMWIATEVNKHHIAPDDTCFVREAFNRQLAAKCRRCFWDLNPDYPTHPIYTDYIDRYRQQGLSVNYEHFTIYDNAAVTPERLTEILAQYEPGSVWYKRAILGERTAAEGLIFPDFAGQPEMWICNEIPDDIQFISIGGDYGGTGSATAFVAVGIRRDFAGICVLASTRLEGLKGVVTPTTLEEKFLDFYRSVEQNFHIPIRYAFMDSEAQYLTNGIRHAARNAHLPLSVCDCKKGLIAARIAAKAKLLAQKKWTVLRTCETVIASTATQTWDAAHPDRRRDDGSTDIDTADAEEYAWSTWIPHLTR